MAMSGHTFSIKGKPKVRIRGIPGSEEFMSAYHAALFGIAEAEKTINIVLRPKVLLAMSALLIMRVLRSEDWMVAPKLGEGTR